MPPESKSVTVRFKGYLLEWVLVLFCALLAWLSLATFSQAAVAGHWWLAVWPLTDMVVNVGVMLIQLARILGGPGQRGTMKGFTLLFTIGVRGRRVAGALGLLGFFLLAWTTPSFLVKFIACGGMATVIMVTLYLERLHLAFRRRQAEGPIASWAPEATFPIIIYPPLPADHFLVDDTRYTCVKCHGGFGEGERVTIVPMMPILGTDMPATPAHATCVFGTFLDFHKGGLTTKSIDDCIEEWHTSTKGQQVSLPEHLGMTNKQYSDWVCGKVDQVADQVLAKTQCAPEK